MSPDCNTLLGTTQPIDETYKDALGKAQVYGLSAWDTQTGKLKWYHATQVICATFASTIPPARQLVATGGSDVRLWDCETGQILRRFKGHTAWAKAVTFSPDNQLIASASSDDTIRLWSTTDGGLLRVVKDENVSSLAFSPDGTTLASGSGDGTVRLWRIK